jgi:glycosidase
MVPPEFWAWAVPRAKQRDPHAYFIAEAYNNDPMKVEGAYLLLSGFRSVSVELLNAGFDAVYDDPSYKVLKHLYDDAGWANDIDNALNMSSLGAKDYVFHHSLRYAENHDEVRLASRDNWGGIGPQIGPAVCALLWSISRGPALIYSGQEVGEPAEGSEGFAEDNGRTSIFDYWCMPEFAKWVNAHRYDGGRLSAEQKRLRANYGKLLRLLGDVAFRDGEFFPLNIHNIQNPGYGRLHDETASGHWLYCCIRATQTSRFIIVINLHPTETMKDVRIQIPLYIIQSIALTPQTILWDEFSDIQADASETGIQMHSLPPLTASFLRLGKSVKR